MSRYYGMGFCGFRVCLVEELLNYLQYFALFFLVCLSGLKLRVKFSACPTPRIDRELK
jgi:hypothetical protein